MYTCFKKEYFQIRGEITKCLKFKIWKQLLVHVKTTTRDILQFKRPLRVMYGPGVLFERTYHKVIN